MTMKKREVIIIAIAIIALSGGDILAYSTYVPLTRWSYEFIERFETRRVISGVLNGTKPLSRFEMAEYLLEIIKRVDAGLKISTVEKQQLEILKSEFKEELGELGIEQNQSYKPKISKIRRHKFVDLILPDAVYQNGRDFFAWNGENINLYAAPIIYASAGFNSADTLDIIEKTYQRTGGFTFRGNLGKYLGFFFDVRDTKEWGTKKYPTGDRFTIERLGYVSGYSTHIYHDETIAYLIFKLPYFEIEFGKNLNKWGPGFRGNLALSDNATSYDQIKLATRIGRIKFTYLTAFLRQFPAIIERKYTTNSGGSVREIEANKYLAGHRLEVSLMKGVDIGVHEIIIYGERGLEPAYLNPIMFFRSAEHFLGDRDNATMGADIDISLIKDLKLYGELFVDDLSVSKIGTSAVVNKLGLLGGIFFVDIFGLDNFDLRLEYARLRPYVYSHYVPINVYKHYDTILGHWTGPNSDDIYCQMNYRFSKDISLSLSFELNRHGSDPDNSNVGGNVDVPHKGGIDSDTARFLDGILETKRSFGIDLSYEIFRNSYLRVGYENLKSKNVFLSNGQRGNTQSNNFVFLIGLNY